MSGILNPAVLVLGASGTVGSGVVAALLEAGSPVLGVARDPDRLARLAQRFADEPGLELLQGSVADDAQAAQLARRLQGRPLRAVVAALAGPLQRGRLLGRPAAHLQRKLESDLLPHLAAARHLLPLLAESDDRAEVAPARYILIGATGAECGWAGYGEASVAAAAQTMLAKVLHEEAAPLGVRVQMLSLDHPVCDPLGNGRNCARWPSALSVGRRAVSMLLHDDRPVKSVVRYSGAWTPPPTRTLFAPPVPPPVSDVSPARPDAPSVPSLPPPHGTSP
jgi:NAD(P)-dependent dehydrogenase (short-subunit alcohol dehydrogenase family)